MLPLFDAVRFAVPALLVPEVAVKLEILVALTVAPELTTKMSEPPKSEIESVPESILKVSFPAPPVKLSLQAHPVMIPLPPSPLKVSFPLLPIIISAPEPPVKLSAPPAPVKE